MAGDWIPYTKDLPRKPEVLFLSAATGRPVAEVVLALLELWGWADSETPDGTIRHAPVTHLSRVCPTLDAQFVDALVRVGWLRLADGYISFPNFERWMGSSAKRRLHEARRKRQYRDSLPKPSRKPRTNVPPAADKCPAESGTTEQNSTGSNPPSPPSGGASAPGREEPKRPDPARTTASDRPDLNAAAKAIAGLYDRRVGLAHGPAGGKAAALELMALGVSAEELRRAVEHYALFCDVRMIEPTARKAAGRFFREGVWEDYVSPPAEAARPAKPARPETAAERRARVEAEVKARKGVADGPR